MGTNNIDLDGFDRKILYELDKNARISTTAIGKKIRKSKQFVDYRIKRMEHLGLLVGYLTVIDYSKLGYQSIRIYFQFHNISPKEQDELENDLIKDKEVWWLVTVEGSWDIAYAIGIKNVLEFYKYWDKILEKYRKYIKKRSVVFYSHIEQYPKGYLVNEKNTSWKTIVGDSTVSIPIDSMNKRLLKILSDNARIPLLELATKLNTSPQVVKSRMNKLKQQGVIQGYKALIDFTLLGYRYYKAYIDLINTEKIGELRQYCFQHTNIVGINRTIGGKDFEIEFQAQSFEEFEAIMREIRSEFDGMIGSYETVTSREEKKMDYFPFE